MHTLSCYKQLIICIIWLKMVTELPYSSNTACYMFSSDCLLPTTESEDLIIPTKLHHQILFIQGTTIDTLHKRDRSGNCTQNYYAEFSNTLLILTSRSTVCSSHNNFKSLCQAQAQHAKPSYLVINYQSGKSLFTIFQ